MEPYEDLIRWGKEKGINMNGIKPLTMPGRGTGVVATRNLHAGETLLLVPNRALRSLHNVPQSIIDVLPKESSLHALLAAYVTLYQDSDFAIWNTSFPPLSSFDSAPLVWPQELQALLPHAAKDLLTKQQLKFDRAWSAFYKAFPTISHENYLHSWLLVNSRSFYYTTTKMRRFPHDDRLALLPIADLFNHSDRGCETKFSTQNYKIIADREYSTGEEVYFCYGGHSNDFLLIEYGFILSENIWDAVPLDELVLPLLSKDQKEILNDNAFLGNYTLDRNNAGCFRTQVALRMLCCSLMQWQSFVDAEDDGEASQRQVDNLLLTCLEKYSIKIHQSLKHIDALEAGDESSRELLRRRWKQIQDMVTHTIKRLNT
ncbi:hypothetical protein B0J11DRAFT_583049 [Dendryphion nanum]|uniref:SET domain-containing protein n=1 Tax=Dendryphion nanum TaxID=256645 RepID=A0A9P9DEB9_9PLEO|nr:hypothetical protein B0J11DRAFT_583049 [Dendryphion nanum]